MHGRNYPIPTVKYMEQGTEEKKQCQRQAFLVRDINNQFIVTQASKLASKHGEHQYYNNRHER
jgi:hypothetical protein